MGRSGERLPSPWWGLWALLRALEGGDAREALREVDAVPVTAHNTMMCGYAEAVLLGQAGRAAAADSTFAAAEAAATPGWWGYLGRRLAAEAALGDGWGDPARWLSGAAVFFDDFPAAPVASACRSLLRRVGAPVPRRPTGVAAPLADLGITLAKPRSSPWSARACPTGTSPHGSTCRRERWRNTWRTSAARSARGHAARWSPTPPRGH